MKTVLITGANRGIGLATSRLLKKRKYNVIGVARSKVKNFPGKFIECDLSNTNEIHLRTLFSRENKDYDEDLLLDHMDREYYSNKLEVRKPNQEIFQAVLIDNQLDPSQCLFIDDKDYNLEGAVGLGINTYHLDLRKENFEDLFDFENDMI